MRKTAPTQHCGSSRSRPSHPPSLSAPELDGLPPLPASLSRLMGSRSAQLGSSQKPWDLHACRDPLIPGHPLLLKQIGLKPRCPMPQAPPSLAWPLWGPALQPWHYSLRPADLTAFGVQPPPCHKAFSSHRQDWPLDLHPVPTPFPHCTPGPLASGVLPALHQHPLAGPAAPRGWVSAGRKGCPTPATAFL